jgi:O-antigen ligase
MQLYGKNTHSVYFTLLSEQGLVGVIALLWLLLDFRHRNRVLRSKKAVAQFDALTDRSLDLRFVAYAVEAAMFGYLLTGFFYAQHHVHWFYTLLALNFALHVNLRSDAKAAAFAFRPAHA